MKGRAGKHLSGSPIYGYKSDPMDKNHWVIDEEAAAVVRRIYQLCVEGNGPFQIAGILEAEKVEIPAYYLAKRGLGNHKSILDTTNPYCWAMGTVSAILARPEYMGHTVSFRTYTESYRTKKRVKNDPDDWFITENTQEPIIDKDTWELVQKLRQTTRRTDTIGVANPLTGLVFCADCGAKMRNRRAKGKPLRSDPTKSGAMDDCYLCSASANGNNQRKKVCSSHRINTNALRGIVLDVIRAAAQSALEDEAAFRARVMSESQTSQKQAAKAIEKKLRQDKQRYEELDALITGLFEANFNGKISDKRFKMMSERYEAEQNELEQAISEGERELAQFQTDTANVEKFLDLAKRYTDFTELTTPMLNQFVDKILVHEAEKMDGERTQEVEVYLNYIGRFDLPEKELSAEELAQLEKDRKRRADSRERCKRYRERQRAKKNADTVA